jgi:hypothetical protein
MDESDQQFLKTVESVSDTTKAGIEAVSKFGSYVGEVLGPIPHDAVGLLIGDWLHAKRIENMERIAEKHRAKLDARGVAQEDRKKLSPRVVVPFMEHASKESDDELQELWARLMANAMDPNANVTMRVEYIEKLKQFEPHDALVLSKAIEIAPTSEQMLDIAQLRINLPRYTPDQLIVCLMNLERLQCVARWTEDNPIEDRGRTTALGRELVRAVAD